jgi:hypothetical protein
MEQAVSAFIVNTCMIRPQPHIYRVQAWLSNIKNAEKTAVGYAVEIYIYSLYPDVQDFPGHVIRNSSNLVISSRRQIPSMLPLAFDDTVTVYEIIDSQFPGYVELKTVGQLRKLPNEDKFTFQPIASPFDSHLIQCASSREYCRLVQKNMSYRCLEWPAQAAEWPARRREFGWPDNSTIRHVVGCGCDLVARSPHVCDQEHELPKRTWSFAFSVAETILLNTWTPAQQIVYHVLRVVVNREIAQYACTGGYRIITVQHLKMLMLTMSEQYSKDHWTRSTVIETCARVMQALMQLYAQQRFMGYFITSVNSFECSSVTLRSSQTIVNHLKFFSGVGRLTDWLISNYVSRCTESCPDSVRQLFCDVSTLSKMKHALSRTAEWSISTAVATSFEAVKSIVRWLPPAIDKRRCYWSLNTVVTWRKELHEIDKRFDGYFTAVVCLANVTIVKSNMSANIPDDVCDMVTAMLISIDKCNKMSVVQKSDSYLLKKAVYLLRVYSQTSCTITSSILLVLVSLYLRRARRCRPKTADSGSICRLTDIYLAIVYFAASRYRAAEHHCTRAIANNSNGRGASLKMQSDVVEGQHLHSIEHGTNAVSGLVILHEFVRNAALGQPRKALRSDVFSAELFAHYLRFVVRSAGGMKSFPSYLFQQYDKRLRRLPSLSCGDCLLFYNVFKSKKIGPSVFNFKEMKVRTSRNFTASGLCRLIIDFSIEQLTQLQQRLSSDYPAEYAVVATDIKAMNVYRRELYGLCSRLSRQNVDSLWGTYGHYRFPMSRCMTHLMDDDLACLSGAFLLVSPASLHSATITQLTLSMYSFVQSLLRIGMSNTSVQSFAHLAANYFHWFCVKKSSLGVPDESVLTFVYRKAVVHIRRAAVGF